MPDTLWMKLRKVRWEDFPTSPSCKKNLPRLLESLASRKESRAMKASHDVWTALCSGKVYPAAEAACPFLIDILQISEPAVQGEILDMLIKFAQVPNDETAESWQKHLHRMLQGEQGYFTKLSGSTDAIVADKASTLIGIIK